MDATTDYLFRILEYARGRWRDADILHNKARPKFKGQSMTIDELFAELNYSLLQQDLRRVSSQTLTDELNTLGIEAKVELYDTLDEGWNVFQVQVRKQ